MLDLETYTWEPLYNTDIKVCGHTADLISGNIYLFGGLNDEECDYTNNVYIFQKDAYDSSLVTTTGIKPPARAYHGSAVIGNDLYIYGGDELEKDLEVKIYSLNTKTLQ